VAADAIVSTVALFSAPGTPMRERPSVSNPTWEGLPLVFLVKEQRDPWLRVLVSTRPNGLEAWIRSADVTLRSVPNWIRVELGARMATVYSGDSVLLRTPVATGRPTTPTPTGQYFVDGIVRLADPGGVYGYGQMSVSAFSEVYETFGGGIGQIALHGTNAPNLLGQTVSNGCVRFDNQAIARVMELAPTGTPVEIVA
ncbi:MAG: L,D-transpeptidase, partial [Acidimicrobiales bacterium]